MSYVEQIRQKASQMSESYLRIADYVMNSYIDVSFMTASDLAAALNLDAATIVRFSQLLGYQGYPQLKKEIQNRVKNELSQSVTKKNLISLVARAEPSAYEIKIQQKRHQMSQAFQRVATYLVDSFLDAAFMTAGEIAKTLKLDTATIVRFSQLLGYTGFPPLHNEIRERAKNFILPRIGNSDVERLSFYDDEMAKRAIADNEIVAETTSLQSVLARQVETIRAYLQGRGTSHPDSEKLCDWVQFCYMFGLYKEGRDLLSFISPSEVHPWYYDRTKKLARLCELKA